MKSKIKIGNLIFCGMLIGISLIFGGLINTSVFAQNKDSQFNLKLKKIKVFEVFYKGYFSHDGTKLALKGGNEVKIVNLFTGKNICKIDIPTATKVLSSVFSNDDKTFAVNYYIYDAKAKKITQHIDLIDSSNCKEIKKLVNLPSKSVGDYLSFSPDNNKIATSAGVPQIWNIEQGKSEIYQSLVPESYTTHNALLSPDGKWLASYSQRFDAPNTYGTFHISNLQTKKNQKLNEDQVMNFTFSADSTLLVTMNRINGKVGWGNAVNIKIYETQNWKIRNEFTVDDEGRYETSAISPDKDLMLLGGEGKFKIFSLQTGKLLAEEYHYKRTLKDDFYGVPHMVSFLTQVGFSPDGKTLLTGGEDGTVKLWQITK